MGSVPPGEGDPGGANVSDTCVKHSFETAVGVCRQCRNSYCAECLIYAFGPDKPPYCVTCALNAAGVRHQGATPNPKKRRRGLFRRKPVTDDGPAPEPGFDDIHIELPERATDPEVTRHVNRRRIDPEVLAMVEAAELAEEPDKSEPVTLATLPRAGDTDTPFGSSESAPWPEGTVDEDPWSQGSTGRAF